jgi:hypothetical protein
MPTGAPTGFCALPRRLSSGAQFVARCHREEQAVLGINKASTEYLSYGSFSGIQEPGLYPWRDAGLHGGVSLRQASACARRFRCRQWHGFPARKKSKKSSMMRCAANRGLWSGLGDDMLRLTALKMAVDRWYHQPHCLDV